MKRAVLLLLPMVWCSTVPPVHANRGGPPAAAWAGRGGLTMSHGGATLPAPAAPSFAGPVRASVPTGGNNGGNRGLVSPGPARVSGGPGFRGSPVVATGPVGVGVRLSPITAGARPVGMVAPPRPVVGPRGFPGANGGLAGSTLPRPPRPPTTALPPAAAPPGNPPALTVPGTNPGRGYRPQFTPGHARLLAQVDRPRPGRAYAFHPERFGHHAGPKAGHYVPGETYVQNTAGSAYGCPPYGFGPGYYLGGAFPFFYGNSLASTGVYLGTGADYSPATDDAAPAPGNPPLPEAGSPLPPEIPPEAAPAPARPLNPALAGPNSLVEAVQMELLRRGYYGGRPDGYFNRDTGEALRRFQENHGLARTGLVNEATLYALGLN